MTTDREEVSAAAPTTTEAAVDSSWLPLGRFRVLRDELRCWPDGRIPDIELAVDSPRRLTDDPDLATTS